MQQRPSAGASAAAHPCCSPLVCAYVCVYWLQPYAYDALEPHIDAATMKVHHQGHHQAYTDKLNAGLDTLKATK